jgi:hypothetical protein
MSAERERGARSGRVNLPRDRRWRFAQFGGLAIATNGADPMAKIDLGSYEATNLGGNPPRLKLLAVVRDFLVGGVTNGEVNTVSWSGINNAERWTVGVDQSDYQIMPTGGEITGLFGGESGIILQRGRIVRMTYVGDSFVFQFDEISYNLGCVTTHSTAQAGRLGFFLSDNGFIMWDGEQLKQIGQERVDRTFAESYGRADWPYMSTAVDVQNNLVVWSMPDRMFAYNWVLDRWTIIEQPANIIFSGFSRDMSLEDLGAIYGSLEDIPYPLDDDRFKGGNPRFYVFNDQNVMGRFAGPAMAASFRLGDQELAGGREVRISSVRPITDATEGVAAYISARDKLGSSLDGEAYSYLTDNGEIPVRESGRFARLGLDIAAGADWTYAQGIDVRAAAGGRR